MNDFFLKDFHHFFLEVVLNFLLMHCFSEVKVLMNVFLKNISFLESYS